MTHLELSDQDAKSFLLFLQHQANFELLLDNRVFELQNGSAEIHFNRDGDIASIDLHAKVFKRESIAHPPVVIVKQVV